MKIRPATREDFEFIDRLYREREFNVEFSHIENAQILMDDNDNPIGIGVFNRILEAAFLVDKNAGKKDILRGFKFLLSRADLIARRLTFDNFHVFSTRSSVTKFLTKKYKFTKTNGEVLVHWTGPK